MREMADPDLFIPSKGEVQEDGSGFVPVLLDQAGITLRRGLHGDVAAASGIAEYLLQANGGAFFRRLPPGYGVIFNPGYDAQLLLPPDGVADAETRPAPGLMALPASPGLGLPHNNTSWED